MSKKLILAYQMNYLYTGNTIESPSGHLSWKGNSFQDGEGKKKIWASSHQRKHHTWYVFRLIIGPVRILFQAFFERQSNGCSNWSKKDKNSGIEYYSCCRICHSRSMDHLCPVWPDWKTINSHKENIYKSDIWNCG